MPDLRLEEGTWNQIKTKTKLLEDDIEIDFDLIFKTGLVIRGITDKHTGKKPEVIMCRSAEEVYEKLKSYIHKGRMPNPNWVNDIVKERGYVELIKEEINNQTIYQL